MKDAPFLFKLWFTIVPILGIAWVAFIIWAIYRLVMWITA